MAFSWKVNTVLGLTSFLFTYFFSITNNTWQTSVVRAIIGFLIFFGLGYILRIVLYQISVKKGPTLNDQPNMEVEYSPNLESEKIDFVGSEEESSSFQQIPLQALHNGNNKET